MSGLPYNLPELQHALFQEHNCARGYLSGVCRAFCQKTLRLAYNPGLPSPESQAVYAVNDGTPKKLERVGIAGYRKDANLCV